MADHKITDFVDQSAIDGLKRLKDEMLSAKDTYIQVAGELVKGLKVPIDGLDQLDKMAKEVSGLQKQAAQAAQKHTEAIGEQGRIISSTTATIARDLQERNKANRAVREEYDGRQRVENLLRQLNGAYNEHVRALNQQKDTLKALSAEQKELERSYQSGKVSVAEYEARMDDLTIQIRQVRQEKSNLETLMRNEERLNASVDGSYANMSQQLELLKKAYKSMTDEEKSSSLGSETAEAINDLDSHLKDLAEDMGEHQRNVGDYAIAGKSMRKEMKEMALEIAYLTVQYNNMSDAERASVEGEALKTHIRELTEEAGVLKDAMMDTNQAIANAASDTRGLDQIAQGVQMLIDGFGFATGAAEMLGLSQGELVEVQTKLQAAIAASNALAGIQNSLQKQSALMQGVAIIQTKARAAATTMATSAESGNVVVTKAATVAQAAFNAVANANPYVLLAVAIVTVIGAIGAYVAATRTQTKAAEENAKAEEKRRGQMERTRDMQNKMSQAISESAGSQIAAFMKLKREWDSLADTFEAKRKFIIANRKAMLDLGISVNEVSKAEGVFNKNTDKVVQAFILRAKAAALEDAYQDAYKQWLSDRDAAIAGTRVKPEIVSKDEVGPYLYGNLPEGDYVKSNPVIEEMMDSYVDSGLRRIGDALSGYFYKIENRDEFDKSYNKYQWDQRNQYMTDADNTLNFRLKDLDGMMQNTTAELESLYKSIGMTLKSAAADTGGGGTATASSSGGHSTSDAKLLTELNGDAVNQRKSYIDTLLALEKEGTQEWLNLKRESLELAEILEYEATTSAYEKQKKELEESLNQKKITQDEYDRLMTDAEETYWNTITAIDLRYESDSEDAMHRHALYLSSQAQLRYANDQAAADAAYQKEMAGLKSHYAEKLKAAGENESEISCIKQEYETLSAEVSEKYAVATAQRQIDMYKTMLDQAGLTAEERAAIETELGKAELELANAQADAVIASQEREQQAYRDTTELHRQEMEKRKEQAGKWLQVAADGLNAINDLASSIFDARIERIEAEQEANTEAGEEEQERIAELVEKKVITEEEGEARKRAAEAQTARKNEELEKKKNQLKHKQAVWDKANSIAQAGIATALAITRALPDMALAAIAGAMGALQIATIIATPIPKYAKGTKDHPGGLAIVGDGGRQEVVSYGGNMFLTPDTPTLIEMPKGAEVFPDADALLASNNDLAASMRQIGDSPQVIVNNDYRRLEREVVNLGYLIKMQTKAQSKSSARANYEFLKARQGL